MSSVIRCHGSPHVATVETSTAALVLHAVIVALGMDPTGFYTAVLGISSMIALPIIFICNVAVVG